MSMNWSLCAGPWGALASGAAQRAFAKQGLVSQPEQQSGTDGRRERSSATPVASASSSPLLSAAQIRSPVHLPARPASEEGLIASSALPAAIHPGTRHAGNVVLREGAGKNSSALFLMELIIPVIARQREKKGCRTPGSCCPCGFAARLQPCLPLTSACTLTFWFFTLLMWSSAFLCVLADLFLSILYSFCSWVPPARF